MERWAHARLQGRNGTHVRVYSVYIPTQSYGVNTTFTQQINVLATKADSRHPRTALIEDLTKELEEAADAGDQIIIGGDFNSDVTNDFWRELNEHLGMVNAIFRRHGEGGPNTWTGGSKQIDAIIVTNGMEIRACGYLPESASPGDHRTIWINTSYTSAFGNPQPLHITKNARRLTLKNPKYAKKYIRHLKARCKETDLGGQIHRLYQTA